MIDLREHESLHRFEHRAMNTVFTVRVAHGDRALAAEAARAAFERLDRLEDALSRYRDGSDVCQINAMEAGQTLLITTDTHRCLVQAFEVTQATGGLFDVTLGAAIEHLKTEAQGEAPPTVGQIGLDPDRPAVHCVEPGRQIDLGGIGKGYALDRMADVLSEWGVASALLGSGASTLLAIGPEAWPIELTARGEARRVALRGAALSASGHAIQGAHLVHPDAPNRLTPGYRHLWIKASGAAYADAWSTAGSMIEPQALGEIEAAAEVVDEVFYESDAGLIVAV